MRRPRVIFFSALLQKAIHFEYCVLYCSLSTVWVFIEIRFYSFVAVVQWNHSCFGVRGGLQAHGFESFSRSECRLGFFTLGNGFLADGL
ncbi:hypothetical protein E2C01_099247 [Portunus trituberculatus]|uniref:Uncharacterized protein n=1 Tax=Portunus trituberculatus TaxID=210409 RepID=A0A5B7KGD2_PORTR|nr:hypothetical protein [Portunus trituberculatus]